MRADHSAGKVVILNVHNGGHWVLTTGVSGTSFIVNDPGFATSSYTEGEVVRAGIFRKSAALLSQSETESDDDYLLLANE